MIQHKEAQIITDNITTPQSTHESNNFKLWILYIKTSNWASWKLVNIFSLIIGIKYKIIKGEQIEIYHEQHNTEEIKRHAYSKKSPFIDLEEIMCMRITSAVMVYRVSFPSSSVNFLKLEV